MITIEYPEREINARSYFDQSTNEFITFPAVKIPAFKLQLEHSLMSIRKWEAEHQQAFSGMEEMKPTELIDYIRCMTVNSQKDENVYDYLTQSDLDRIVQYITKHNSAWTIRTQKENGKGKKKKAPTVESIYYAMIQLGIPFDCEKWHLNSLMALIDYCSSKGGGNSPQNRKTMREMQESWYKINEANRKKYHSRG